MNITLRSEAPTDIAAIEALTAAAFLNAPHSSHTEQFIINALRKAGQLSVSLVAEENGLIVGHVAVSPVTISDGTGGWYGLGPLSVVPKHQNKGIGSRLMERILSMLREMGAAGCVVLGEPGYYGRFGFKAEQELVLPDVPPEYFQVIAFLQKLPSGKVAYHEAFTRTGRTKQ